MLRIQATRPPSLSNLFIKISVEGYYTQGRRGWVRLHEKGSKRHEMPCNHNLEAYLGAYIGSAGFAGDLKGYLFRTVRGRGRALTTNPLAQADVYRMIRRKALAAGIKTRIGSHPFRATRITQYLRNGGRRELAQQMAAHESPRTTALYDRRDDEVAVDEVERILIWTVPIRSDLVLESAKTSCVASARSMAQNCCWAFAILIHITLRPS
jgi:integrase